MWIALLFLLPGFSGFVWDKRERRFTVSFEVTCGNQPVTGLVKFKEKDGESLIEWNMTRIENNLVFKEGAYKTNEDEFEITISSYCNKLNKLVQVG